MQENLDDGTFGISMKIQGIVTSVVDDTAFNRIFFTVAVTGVKNDILAEYEYSKYYPIRKKDKVYMEGAYGMIIFNHINQKCFQVANITARYEMNLTNFLADTFPALENTQALHFLAGKIIDYAEMFYDSVTQCLGSLASSRSREKDIDDFTRAIYGEDSNFEGKLKLIKKFLLEYRNNGLRRPLQLLEISDKEIDNLTIPLDKAYATIVVNPYMCPEVSLDIASNICINHIRYDEIPEEWERCGEMNRFIYKKLKESKWTSVPTEKVRSAFLKYFDTYKDALLKKYFIVEHLGHLYYEPIKQKEDVISAYIAGRIKAGKNQPLVPLYDGIEPSEEQDIAIRAALENKITVITGAAGTGKTTVLGHIGKTLLRNDKIPLYTAFTGVAVKRIKVSLKKQGILDRCKVMTIHRAIALQASFDELVMSHVIFDEFSMVDFQLFYSFVNTFARKDLSYIFVGDVNQIEPISYGTIMRQLFKTPISIHRLTHNFRSETGILNIIDQVVDPVRINSQKMVNWHQLSSDYEFHIGDICLLRQYINFQYSQFEGDSDEEFIRYRDLLTIVVPYNKVRDEVNKIFQEIFMENFEFIVIDGVKFHLYDRVMKLVNDYNADVMNGEVGNICEIQEDYVVVKFLDVVDGTFKLCPFFSKHALKRIREKMKQLQIEYSPFTKNEFGISVEKSMEVIQAELAEIRESKRNFPDIDDFFRVAINFPFAVFEKSGNDEFMSIKSLTLAYAVTTNKSQGDQYPVCVYFLSGPITRFVTFRNLYTGLSRAEKKLVIITESRELLNAASLNTGYYTYENLAVQINNRLPEEMRVQIVDEVVPTNRDECDFGDCCDIDYSDLDFDF